MAIYHLQAAAFLDASGLVGHPTGVSVLLEVSDPLAAEAPGGSSSFPPITLRGRLRIIAAGSAAELKAHPALSSAISIRRPNAVLMPGLINAHTHLDLTHIGPQPHDPGQGFVAWGNLIRSGRVTDPGAIAQSVSQGIALSLLGGTVAVGDIAGTVGPYPKLDAFEALAASPLRGVSFAEYFAITPGSGAALPQRLGPVVERAGLYPAGSRVRLGLQPHAPYSVGPAGYQFARQMLAQGVPVSTHLAETRQEHEFVSSGTGPFNAFLASLGLWDDGLLKTFGSGRSPVEQLCAPEYAADGAISNPNAWSGLLAAHLNDVSDSDIDFLARAGIAVAYCPRASRYFGAPDVFGPHRYRDMLVAGIPVCLGTDSVVNLPPEDVQARGMSMIDEIRLLYQRDGVSITLAQLTAMATTIPAKVLGLDPDAFTFGPGAIYGVVAVEPSESVGSAKIPNVPLSTSTTESLFSATKGPLTSFIALGN